MKMIDPGWQRRELGQALESALEQLIETGEFVGGSQVASFEAAFSEFLGGGHTVGVGNGTDALEIILEAWGIGPGDEVVLPAMTFVADAEAVVRRGATAVLIDVDESGVAAAATYQEAISESTAAVLAVHLYGLPVDVPALRELLEGTGVRTLEDAAQAHGARIHGQVAGSLGDASAFSFYPGKNLGAWGDAGALFVRDNEMAKICRMLANHGRLDKHGHAVAGRNSRLDTLQAVVLQQKLTKLDEWNARRRATADLYFEALGDIEWMHLPRVPEWAVPVWHQFNCLVPDRQGLADHLASKGVPTGLHYPYSLDELDFMKGERWVGDLRNARQRAREGLSLPIGEHLTSSDVALIIEAIRGYSPLNRHR